MGDKSLYYYSNMLFSLILLFLFFMLCLFYCEEIQCKTAIMTMENIALSNRNSYTGKIKIGTIHDITLIVNNAPAVFPPNFISYFSIIDTSGKIYYHSVFFPSSKCCYAGKIYSCMYLHVHDIKPDTYNYNFKIAVPLAVTAPAMSIFAVPIDEFLGLKIQITMLLANNRRIMWTYVRNCFLHSNGGQTLPNG